tara:strand:+ start:267 stop:473 length:207 start_codon:yes stop_codon:yes gene_type:complete
MKNSLSEIKSKIMQRYNSDNESLYGSKSTNINVLLNRVKLDKKKESRKKILFSAATSLGVILFGILIF